MKHIKKLNEFFGGKSSEVLLPKLDEITKKLSEIRNKVVREDSDNDTRKIETIYNFLIHNMDLHMLATTHRKSDELTGRRSKEGFGAKIKRSRKNW